jgi:hypothetical protein
MPSVRFSHGCAQVGNTDYIIVMGGHNGNTLLTDVLFYNIAARLWESYPSRIFLPEQMANVQAVVALQLDTEGCNMMILHHWPLQKLQVCTGNYTWKWIGTSGKNDLQTKFAIVGSNELLPCGIQ